MTLSKEQDYSPAPSTSQEKGSEGEHESSINHKNGEESDVDEEQFQKSLQLFVRNPQKRKAKADKKAGKEEATGDNGAGSKKRMKKDGSTKKIKGSKAQEVFKTFRNE